jgi:monovalent cation:proton antiporter-2 (CPA2) family protein
MHEFFAQAFAYLAAAVVAVLLAKRLGLGSVLGYLIAGVAIGPFGLGFVGEEGTDVMHFAEFGVVMMLFVIGLELDPRELWKQRGVLLGLGGLQVGVTTAVLAAVGLALGLPWQSALAAGGILALSSTAIVLQSLQERGWLSLDGGQRSLVVLLFQDVAVIPMIALLPLLAVTAAVIPDDGGHSASIVAHWPAWGRALATVVAVGSLVAGGRFVVGPAFRAIARARLREAFTAAALLLVIGIALLMQFVGLSPALGAFVAGIVLASSEFRHELEGDLEPFKGLLLGLFFLAVGASVDFGLVGERLGTVLGLVFALMFIKGAVLFGLGRVYGLQLDQRWLFAFALAQGGEFCFVLLSLATSAGVLTGDVAGILVAVVALSMALTPVGLVFYDRVIRPRFGTKEAPTARAHDEVHGEAPVLVLGYGHFGSTLGRLLRAVGVRQTVLDNDADRVDLLRRMGLEVYYGDAAREELLRAAGAERARVACVCFSDIEQTRRVVHSIRRHFPALRVLVRVDDRPDAYQMIETGVTEVYRDSLDTSLRMGTDALRAVGIPAHEAHRAAQAFRRYDERNLQRLASGFRTDQAVSMAREAIEDLERQLQQDQQRTRTLDAGAWDPESLRDEFGGMGR